MESVADAPLPGAEPEGATVPDEAVGAVEGSDAEGADEAVADWRGVRVVARRATVGWLVACWAAACCALRAASPALSLARSVWVSIGPTATTSSRRRTRATSPRRPPTMPPGVQVASFGTSRAARGRLRSGRRRMATGRAGASQAGVAAGDDVAAGVRRTGPAAGSASGAGESASEDATGVHQRGGAELPARPCGPGPINARRTSTGREVAAAKRVTDEARLPIRLGSGMPSGGPGSRIRRTTSRPSRRSAGAVWSAGVVVMRPA
ncbi:hypothetical protein GCM10023350_45830 [Nocardioides endophyticus]|uniref:Uncharacterized protein n=1 Tax=Nocardioides endophyticus TaxID=1353775 RepID=A0ABP8ZFA9_9ACTN